MDFCFLHLYQSNTVPQPSIETIVAEIRTKIPGIRVDIRDSFQHHWRINDFDDIFVHAMISDLKQPFDRQPNDDKSDYLLYDGFVLQRLLSQAISQDEMSLKHIHVIITDKLACTFDEDDWRYHARTVICGTPSIISASGIVEGPAKPKEYYYLSRPGFTDDSFLTKKCAGKFIDYGDTRLPEAILLYLHQIIFYFITDGTPFCHDQNCRLYNSHWQEELVRILSNPKLCEYHESLLNEFNAGSG